MNKIYTECVAYSRIKMKVGSKVGTKTSETIAAHHLSITSSRPREHLILRNLSAKSDTKAIADWAVVRNTIGRLSEDTRARGRGWRARTLEATRIGAPEREPPLTKRIAINFAEIIADLPVASVCVFEL